MYRYHLILLASGLAGCFNPEYDAGGFACTTGQCPAGYTCVSEGANKVCRKEGTPAADLPAVAPDGGTDHLILAGDQSVETPAVLIDCQGKASGTNCSTSGAEGFICLEGKCLASTCGDKYVDTAAGEECDDANADPDDGCNTCRFGCKDSDACNDKLTCNGEETCDTTAHKCVAGTPANDGTSCTLSTGSDGVCNGGTCAPAGCGNNLKDGAEECDDGNKDDGDGCNNDCTFSCHGDGDCSDSDVCTGTEDCKMETNKQYCVKGQPLECNDSKTCTADSCDPTAGCVNKPIDADNDGKSCDDDCNDNDPAIYVGAPECADGKDNDCDKQTDEAPLAPGKCWYDFDKDTFAPSSATEIAGCTCPAGYTNRDPSVAANQDCASGIFDVNPGQTGWFSSAYCALMGLCFPPPCTAKCQKFSFDYNCDTIESHRYKDKAGICEVSFLSKCKGSGWTGTSVPFCGVEAEYQTCSYNIISKSCKGSKALRKQECQ